MRIAGHLTMLFIGTLLSACETNFMVRYDEVKDDAIRVRAASGTVSSAVEQPVVTLPDGAVLGHSHSGWLCTLNSPLFFKNPNAKTRQPSPFLAPYRNKDTEVSISGLRGVLSDELSKSGYRVTGTPADYVVKAEIPAARVNYCIGAANAVPTKGQHWEDGIIRVNWTVLRSTDGTIACRKTLDGVVRYKVEWDVKLDPKERKKSTRPEPLTLDVIGKAFRQSVGRMLADLSFPGVRDFRT
jgi:hypothetical protein